MNKSKLLKKVPLFIMICIDVILVIAVIGLMTYVRHLLESDARVNLTEIVTQNKDVINNKLMLEVKNLELVSKQLSDRYSQLEDKNQETLKETFLRLSEQKGDIISYLALENGTAVMPNGESFDLSGRKYFKTAMQGTENISERIVSRLSGEDIFVISVPLECDGKIIGSIQRPYSPEEMYDICSLSLFSQQGDMYIINSQGYILFSSQQDVYNLESDNYYRILYLNDPESSKKLESDIKNETAGFMDTVQDGKKYFSAYTPITKIPDWYLITRVETDAVAMNANIVTKLFYIILLVVVIVFGITLLSMVRLKSKQQQKLEEIALVDDVTGGNTYFKFMIHVENLNKSGKYNILTFDIDNFKYINNFYGFDVGNHILRSIYQSYSEKLSPPECCARIYNDHFVLLLTDISEKRLDKLFQPYITVDGIRIYLSAGLYPITDLNENINLMVDKANIAAQKGKGLRRKRVEAFSAEYDEQLKLNEKIKRDIEQALTEDEIIPFFQPKVDIDTGKLVGAEALARWVTKTGEIIPPFRFISICEQSGLIETVDLCILEKTLQFIHQNLTQGVQCVPVSVNLSRYHLMNEELPALLDRKLKEYQIPPDLIEIEITETVIFDNYKLIEEFITHLHGIGLKVSIDDFGSGYSCLHMLKDIDVDVLKIDRGFLLETINSDRQKTIFGAIAQMAHALQIKVVVEGVETLENIRMMKEFGCTIAQGYYYSKPVDKQMFETIYRKGSL
ncbi:bifunctional diguanylate cyclase/phosphodiesterase [Hungatella hathewayi]|uniref:bifunctional diguanylate cyclase/phosphodiesterase n=1 Tax=Hungatella hathewayi TaxID=154046 RepID=UPI003568BFCB